MIVVDTSALMAILLDEPEAKPFFRTIMASPRTCIGAPTLLELHIVTARDRIGDPAQRVVELLSSLALDVAAWDAIHADVARTAFLRFGKGRHPAKLNFGDCMSYALAKSLDAPLLFKGDDFALTDVRVAMPYA